MTAHLIYPSDQPFLEQSLETLPRDQVRDLQWAKLKTLAREVFPANPFITNKWKAAGLRSADDLRSWDDFYALPFTRKSEFAADQAERPPFGSNLTYPLGQYVRVHQTSGTTGTPIRWLDTQASWEWLGRCWAFVFRGAGVTAADCVFFPFSFSYFIGFWQAFEGARQVGAMTIPAGGLDTLSRLHVMESLGATVLIATPSYALRLLEVAEERGIDLSKLPVHTTIHAGEPGVGIPSTRRRLEKGFGARSFDHTGMCEVGPYGFECMTRAGPHLLEAEFIFEVIDPNTARPAREGELVVTNLGRHGSPVIRYRTGDKVCIDETPCECGRTFPRLRGGILGRVDDMLIVRGVNVFPSSLEEIVRSFEAVDEFLIEVYKEAAMDEIRLLVEIDEGKHAAPVVDGTVQGIVERVRNEVGIRVSARAVPHGELPRFELKAQRVVRVDS